MSSSIKYLLLVAPAALMIAILFLYPLGFSLVSAFTAPGQPFTLDHFRKVYALYASDVLFSLLIVLISVALLALLAITLSAVIALSPCRPVVRLLGFLYRLPLFIPFIVVAQMMRTFLAKNGLMNNALVAADLVIALFDGLTGLAVGVVLWGLHMGMTQGLLAALVADAAPAELRGTAFGVFNLAGGLALLVASVVAGGLWDAFGSRSTFLCGAAFAALALVGLAWRRPDSARG